MLKLKHLDGALRQEQMQERAAWKALNDCPPLPPTRMRHRGDKINQRGGVSALCFPKPHAIDMKRATWVMTDDAVTCPKCRALIDARGKTPNVAGNRLAEGKSELTGLLGVPARSEKE